MEKVLNADQNKVTRAVVLITEVLEKHRIPQLEGAIAMRTLLAVLAENGLDVRAEKRLNS